MVAPVPAQPSIEARGVSKLFGEGPSAVRALDNVSVSIAENEFFTLLGPSGCCKTTLLRLIAGFDHPTLEQAAPYDLVLANILKQPLIDLAGDMARNVAPEGKIILSGILTTQADEVVAAYGKTGFTLDRRDDQGDWSTLVLTRG